MMRYLFPILDNLVISTAVAILIATLILTMTGCVTQIENTYHVTGNQNKFTVSDAVSATPNNKDLIDLAGSGYGDAGVTK